MKLSKTQPSEETPLTDAQLIARAYDQSPSLPSLQRAVAKQTQIHAEYEAKERECDGLSRRLVEQQQGRGIDDAVSRILRSPLDEPLFGGSPELGISEKFQHASKELEAMRRARIAIDDEVKRLRVEVSREMGDALRPRQNELVAVVVAAGREFVETMRRERALHNALVSYGPHVGNDTLPPVVFYGFLTAEDNFQRFDEWLKDLRRAGFAV